MKSAAAIACLTAILVAEPAAAAQWSVDYAKSRLGFSVMWGSEPFVAVFASWKANIDFDPADLARARADVRIDLASEQSDEADYDDGLKGAQGFQVSQFPQAHFVTTGFAHKSGNAYVANGLLSIRGVTKAVTLPFSLTIEGGHAHMKGTAAVLRTDFNVGQGMWSAPNPVAREVTVTIDLYATRK